ncbi:S8 family peptidase [Demequina iriomotensis]|uniref:S8 family peptidase n=1 Tax=Demequina iriomotensis TaxID=1536641 RepID=UPI000780A965|nr:S8 family serine peptidase [Demequina iriomotensis]
MVLPPSDEGRDREVAQGEWGGETVEYLPRRVIVKFKRPDGLEALAATAVRAAEVAEELEGATVLRAPSPTGRVVIDVGEGADALEVAARLAEGDAVEYAEPDVVDHACIVPNDTRYPNQWALPKVNAPGAWDRETGKPTVVIGIIDSGISMTAGGALDHPDLSDASRIVLGTDFVDGGTPRDLNGHGTHVAGIAAGLGNNSTGIAGMNWGSRVYVCRTLDAAGNGSSADFADAVEEITDFAVANGLKAVINYSGGGGANQTKLDACNYASSRGMILCAAAGNDNGGPVIWPAAYSTTVTGVIAVGSTDSADNVSTFSNHGPEVTVVAPGTAILSAMPTYTVTIPAGTTFGTLNGTSMATPLVSGLVGLMWSKNSSKTHASIKQCLIDTAVELGAGTFDNAWGHGRVDAEEAVKCVEPIFHLTKIDATCGISRIAICQSALTPCEIKSQLVVCRPSMLPNLCQRSKLPLLCPIESVVKVCHPVTMIGCNQLTRLGCPQPSAIDACPSSLACGPFDPGRPPILRPGEAGGSVPAGYSYVDESGQAHEWQPEADAGAEVWEGEGGEYFWVDDDGRFHEWRG